MTLNFTVENLEVFLLILVRVSAFIVSAPFFSLRYIPAKVKACLSFYLALLLYNTLGISSIEYNGIIELAVLIFKEAAAGLLLGYITNVCLYILNFSGNLMDMEIGFSMVTEFDPASNVSSTITATLYTNAVTLLMMVTYMHHYVLKAFIETFELIPLGSVQLQPDMYKIMLTFMGDYFILGFRIVLPVFATLLILNVVLGILAKVAPQMNMFSIGMQLKVAGGLCILFIVISLLPQVSDIIYSEMQKMFQLVTTSMQG
jgi:flagellar biosynthetic protein FliR